MKKILALALSLALPSPSAAAVSRGRFPVGRALSLPGSQLPGQTVSYGVPVAAPGALSEGALRPVLVTVDGAVEIRLAPAAAASSGRPATTPSQPPQGATEKASSRLGGLLRRLGAPFGVPLIDVPVPAAGSAASYQPLSAPQAPVSKIVSHLREAADKKDDEAVLTLAETLLSGDNRLEVRLAAVRFAASIPGERSAKILTVELRKDPSYYIRREAAKRLGDRAPDAPAFQAHIKEALLQTLKEQTGAEAAGERESLLLMAAWAYERHGENPQEFLDAHAKNRPVFVPPQQKAEEAKAPQPTFFRRVAPYLAIYLVINLLFGQPQPKAPTAPPAQVEQVVPAPPTDSEVMRDIAKQLKRQADMNEAEIQKREAAKTGPLGSFIGMVFPIMLLVGGMYFLQKYMMGGLGKGKKKLKAERPTTRFSDVAGIGDARQELEEIVEFLHNPARFKRTGAQIPKGALLVGPPGTGKTLLARAVAGETGSNFYSMAGSEFVEMFVGVGASRARDLFEQAKKNAPAIIFIDEIDAIAKKRGARISNGNDEAESTLNQLLVEMDGFDNSSGVIVLAATNREEMLDPAITRPGRLDRKVQVQPADVLGREAIMQVHAREVPLAPDVDFQAASKQTPGMSGADLKSVVNESALLAARRFAERAGGKDVEEAVDKIIMGGRRNLYMAPELKRRVAYHEAGHIIAGWFKSGKRPHKVTIIPHGKGALGFANLGGEDDRFLYTEEELEAQLVGIFGGLTAEKLVFNRKTSTGPGGDLQMATKIARLMVEKLGMSDSVGYGVSQLDDDPYGRKLVSEATSRQIDREVKRILAAAQAEAEKLISDNRPAFDALVAELLQHETLTGDDIERVVKGK